MDNAKWYLYCDNKLLDSTKSPRDSYILAVKARKLKDKGFKVRFIRKDKVTIITRII